jgi:hypothetical protein
MKKIIYITALLLFGGFFGYLIFSMQNPAISDLTTKEVYTRVIAERDFAIGQAVQAGDYRCCIDPPCTMCYMEANQWNDYTAGTCACDDLIARGEEACPQCQRDLDDIHSGDNTFCSINDTVATCSSTNILK